MHNAPERIPIPPPQRWEIFRERIFPVLCFIATILACAALWRHESRVAPFALGEVHVETAKLRSPIDGEVLAMDDSPNGQWPKFGEVKKGSVAARVKGSSEGAEAIDIPAPFTGAVTAIHAHAGQHVIRGDAILSLTSPEVKYLVCHLPQAGQAPPKVGAAVDIRGLGQATAWTRSVVLAVGPAVEEAAPSEGFDAARPVRGLPLRVAVPPEMSLLPGSLVEVRFHSID